LITVMNEFFTAIGAILLWRLLLGLAGSVALAAVLALLFQEFTGGYVVATVLLGTAFGAYWQSRRASGLTLTQPVAEPRIGRAIAFAGLALVGLLVGGFAGEVLHSKVLGVVALLLGAALVAFWSEARSKRPFSLRIWTFGSLALVTGYAMLLLVSRLGGH
jgi:hypothetical protein